MRLSLILQRLVGQSKVQMNKLNEENRFPARTLSSEEEELRHRLRAAELLLSRYRTEREILESTVAWKLIHRYWDWNIRWLPLGSRRRNAYTALVRGLGRLLFRLRVREQIPDQLGSPGQPSYQTGSDKKNVQKPQDEIRVNCEEPKAAEFCLGTVVIRGWALAPSGVENVEILLNGEKIAQATHGQRRPDVGRKFPDIENCEFCGFSHLWDSSEAQEGPHLLTVSVLSKQGTRKDTQVPVLIDPTLKIREYVRWIRHHEPGPEELKKMAREAKRFSYQPLVSIVVPVYKTPIKFLLEAIESVRNQIYLNWELCLADDASFNEEITRLLTEYAGDDPRIKFTQLPQHGGTSQATNAALSLVKGDFVAFLDHDDVLAPDALYEVVKLLQEHPDADLIYSDEDKLDSTNKRFDPFFKPDWSPDLLLSMNYMGHFVVVRKRLVETIGGLRDEYDGSQDYDFLLRVVEQTDQIHHIPRVLYHWRASETSTAISPDGKPKANKAAQQAIRDYLNRNKIAADVEPGVTTGRWRVRYEILERPRVALIVPTGGRMDFLRPFLESVFAQTDYLNHEILLIDNSKGRDVEEYILHLSNRNENLTYLDRRDQSFNFSALCNFGVRQTSAPLVLFLNDDTETTHPDWLTAMVEHAQRLTVGAVGPKLLFPSGLIQHAWIVMGLYENAGHAFRNFPGDSRAYFGFPQIVRNCSAVIGACLLTNRNIFLELGGFNEKNLAVAFQDVDYCLRLCQKGYLVVYTPHAVLLHYESPTKTNITEPGEVEFMVHQWKDVIARDPYYSPNLTRQTEDFSLNLD